MKKIYILHQYLDKSHFQALYECAKEYGYNVEDYFIADKWFILKNIIKKEIFHKKLGLSLKEGIEYLKKQKEIKNLEGQLLVVGLAPYDQLLFKYHNVIQNNNSIYFSSWQTWDGSNFPRGNIKNRQQWERILRNDFKGAACVSRATQRGLSEFIEKTCVVNHALPIDEYVKKEEYIKKYKFLYFGRFEDAKNMKFIIKWLKKNKDIECTLDFAGFGSYEREIKELEKKDNRVKYLGLLSKSELKKIIYTYDFVLLPSKVEPFGISLLEALAAGTPCLTSNALGPSEIITDNYNGIVCDKDDYDSYEKAMDRALNISEEEYKKICINAALSGKKYSSNCIAKIWCDLFDEIIENKS